MKENDPIEPDPEQRNLWEDDPDRAARLAYLELLVLWDRQVREGEYRGVPCFHGKASKSAPTTRSKSPNYAPDSDAGVWVVPGQIRNRWEDAA